MGEYIYHHNGQNTGTIDHPDVNDESVSAGGAGVIADIVKPRPQDKDLNKDLCCDTTGALYDAIHGKLQAKVKHNC